MGALSGTYAGEQERRISKLVRSLSGSIETRPLFVMNGVRLQRNSCLLIVVQCLLARIIPLTPDCYPVVARVLDEEIGYWRRAYLFPKLCLPWRKKRDTTEAAHGFRRSQIVVPSCTEPASHLG
jgi:hypothetical protein